MCHSAPFKIEVTDPDWLVPVDRDFVGARQGIAALFKVVILLLPLTRPSRVVGLQRPQRRLEPGSPAPPACVA